MHLACSIRGTPRSRDLPRSESGSQVAAGSQDGTAGDASADEFPLVLIAGERRSYNANTIFRDEAWRQDDAHGALKMHADDASALGLDSGQLVVCESARGAVEARVEITDELKPGVVSLPHGYGMSDPGADGTAGPAINELTASDHCDPIAKTPFHKHVAVRVRAVAPAAS